jgi:deazaflavin-dependent oxidoreductase (nitroreductase family)
VSNDRLGLWRPKPGRWGTLRLTTTGRRTGRPRSVIVAYLQDGPNLVTLAMNGWADPEPAWWLNLQTQPDATVKLVGETRAVRARAAQGTDRSRLWARWSDIDRATGRLCGQTVIPDRGGDPGTATGIALIGRARP